MEGYQGSIKINAMRCNYSSCGRTDSTLNMSCTATTRPPVASTLLRLCCAFGRIVSMLDFSSVGRAGSHRVSGHSVVHRDYPSRGRNGYTSPTPRVWVLRLVTRLIVDYFDYAASPGASARHAVRHAFVVNFDYTTRLGASVRCAARRRLLRLAQARRRLLHLRRASGCLRMSRGSSRRLSLTTSPTPRVRVPRHVVRLVTRLVVDYSVRRDFILRPHWLYFSHAVRREYLSRGSTGSTSSTPCVAICRSHRVDHSSRLVFHQVDVKIVFLNGIYMKMST
jgi:hypothetical protein